MERDLIELFEAAKRAADAANAQGLLLGKSESSRCVDALTKLQTFPVNPKILDSFRIFERLERLTKSKDCKIRRSASDLLQHWQQKIASANQERQDFSAKKKPNDPMAQNGSTAKKNGVIFRLKLPKTGPSSSDQKIQAFPSCAPVIAKDESRDKIRTMIVEALSRVSKEVDDKLMREKVKQCSPERVGWEVELEMFEKMGPLNGKMKNKYRSIVFNLTDSKNPDFRRNVLLGQITPQTLVNMKIEEMASSERRCQINMCKERAFIRQEAKIYKEITMKPVQDDAF